MDRFFDSQVLQDLKDFRPRGVRLVVHAFVRIDGHQVQELFASHLAFFSGLGEVGAAPTGAPASLQTRAPFEAGPSTALRRRS